MRSKGRVVMLSKQTIDIIKSTVPVLEVHGVAITKTFYHNLLTDHPALFNIFNRTNQSKGRQQGALANTVYAAAVHIENLEPIVPVVVRIAHKHRSLGVLPEHYTIVGEYLLAAIKEVLQDAATDAIIDAWAQAYGVIADIFISVEEDLYKAAEQDGGWRIFKSFNIARKEVESDCITSIYFTPADGAALPAATPGQYVTIRAQVPGEDYLMNRQYTLTEATADYYRISVKTEKDASPAGIVSTFLHEAAIGTAIDMSTPAGTFTLQPTTTKALFIAGGVGVTPLHTMLQSMTAGNASFIQCARNEKVAAFTESIAQKVAALHGDMVSIYSEQQGHITAEQIAAVYTEGMDVYVCGPTPFMENVLAQLASLNVPTENIHFEFFGPALAL